MTPQRQTFPSGTHMLAWIVLDDAEAIFLHAYPVGQPLSSVHAAAQRRPLAPMVTHEPPTPPQSALALQRAHRRSSRAYGCSVGLSSMPWMPYMVWSPQAPAPSRSSSSDSA